MRNSDRVFGNRYVYLCFRNVDSVEVRKGTLPSVTYDTLYATIIAPLRKGSWRAAPEGSNVAISGIVGSA